VSEYENNSYLAPTTAQWDTLCALVADLEEKLMGCPEITALLEEMLTQLVCVCDKTTQSLQNDVSTPNYSPATQNIIDNYYTSGGLQDEDDYADDAIPDEDRCAVAQLVFWQAWEFTTEVMHPTAEQTIDILLPAAMVAIAAWVGTLALAIPVGIILAVLWALIEIDVAGSMENVTNAMWANKQELICAVWNGLAIDARAAEESAHVVIDSIDGLSALDKIALRLLYSPWAIALCVKAFDNETAWAVAHVTPGQCDTCEWWTQEIWALPPCPGAWTGTFTCTPEGRLGIKSDTLAYSDTFVLPDILQSVDFTLAIEWTSVHPVGWTVGYVWVQYQDIGEGWHDVAALTCTNNAIAGTVNTASGDLIDKTIPRNALRIKCNGQAGQSQTNPWPFEVGYVKLTAVPH